MAMKPTDQEIGMLYREGGAAEPSAELDHSILAAARAAVAVKPARSPWWKRWRLPVQALASVAVVGMLVMMANQQPPDVVMGDIALNAQPAEAPAPALAEGAAMEKEKAKAMPSVAKRESRSVERAAVRPGAPLVLRPAPATEVHTVPAPARPAPVLAPVAPAELASLEVPSAEPAVSAAPVARAMASATPQNDEVLGSQAKMAAPQASVPAAPTVAVRPAKEWLESIKVLIDQGRIEEAKTSLAAFERANPSVVVPDGLRKQLK